VKILVTGSNGLVGSRLCVQLAEAGHHVTGFSRGIRRATGAFGYASVELTDAAQTREAIAALAPEVILHPASMTEVDACEKNPAQAYAVNVEATATVAKAAREVGAHLVHVSTDYVFDGEAGPYDEAATPNPRGVYAVTKHMGEEAVKVLAGSWAIARTAVVFGLPEAGRPNFGAWLVKALEAKQPLKLFQDQFVSPSLADSVAEMVGELGTRKHTGIWNICGAEVVDRVSFGRAVCELFGFDPGLITPSKMADLKLASPRPARSGLKVDKVKAQLKAQPLMLHEALTRLRASYLQSKGQP
jgi:dTDP-4-dehydrorhamnose reductase